MLYSIKNFLKKFIPPTINIFNRENAKLFAAVKMCIQETQELSKSQKQLTAKHINDIQNTIQSFLQQQDMYTEELKQYFAEFHNRYSKELEQKSTQILCTLAEYQKQNSALLEALYSELNQKVSQTNVIQNKMLTSVEKSTNGINSNNRILNETLWAEIFHDSIAGSTWLKDKTFFPGRWAVGYPCLYVMYRILNEFKPAAILELGLGQSTRMTAQYMRTFNRGEHFVVEHDPGWIEFFSRDFELPNNTRILQFPLGKVNYKDGENIRIYKGFNEQFTNRKFDFIFIDAPFGYDMPVYARIDVLHLMPHCLASSFVILLDDYNRKGEQNTARQMTQKLEDSHISFCTGTYSGMKNILIICSEDLKFLCSL